MNKSHLLLGAATFVVAASVSLPAYAQEAPAEAAECADANNDGICDSDETAGAASDIVVTGSRIRRNQFNTADPVQLITRDESTLAGFNSTAEVLQSTTVTGGSSQINNSFGGFVTAGGPGANTISLRGFGTTRTLVLLNGRRVSPAGSRGSVGAADLNVLPNAMIERVEILNGGASSIYGSDAIAGVINIITRQPKGLELEAQHNIAELGSGNSRRYSLSFGTDGDRFSISGSLEYYKRDSVSLGDADWARCQTQFRKVAGGANDSGSFIDPVTGQPKCYTTGTTGESGVTVNTIGTPDFLGGVVDMALGAPAGYNGTCNRFRPDATAGGAIPGYECVGGGNLNINLRDTMPDSLLRNDLISGAEIYTGFLQGSYKVEALGDAEVYGEVLFNRRKSSQLQNRQFTIDYPHLSPLIPANLQFPTRFLAPQATNPGVDVGIRVFADYGNYESRQTNDYVKAVAGIRGNLPANWRYDLYVAKAWSDSDYTTDLILTDRLNQSLDVVASGGGFACRNASRGCVAAPALTPEVVGGQFPAEWINFVVQPVTGNTKFRETTASLVVDGALFDLPGGPVSVALGAEYRKSKINDTPSIESQTGNTFNFSSSSITRGSDAVWEIFGEVELPLLRDVPFAYDLTLTASGRYTEYDSYGGGETYKLGGIYSPVKWLSFRGSYGTSYRAPALFEQFLGSTSGFQSAASDPCNNLSPVTTAPARYANCRADGIPDGFMQTNSIRVNQRGGAESGLGAETSKAWTVGAVVQPDFGSMGRLSISADYFDIEVNNGVSQLGFGAILQQCYDDPDFRAESICGLVTRDPANRALTVVTGFVNISNSFVAGWDFNLRYVVPVGPGSLRFNAQATKFNKRYSQTLPTDPAEDNIGTVNNPEWSGTFELGYKIDRWNFRYGVDWLDGTNSSADYIGLSEAARETYVFETKDYFLHSASLRWQGDRFGFTAGVRNLMDKKPPFISAGAYNRIGNAPLYSGYDYLGRSFFVAVTAGF